MAVNGYIHCFKVKPVKDTDDLQTLTQLYGGYIKLDAHLYPSEYWYYTNYPKETFNKSVLIKIID
ncbi:hypothetical protein ACW2QC_09320 [Virgibacillus sp. FSP13]